MFALFFIFLLIQVLIFFRTRRASLILFILNLAFMVMMFIHHITENIPVRL